MESTEVFTAKVYLNSESASIKVTSGDILGRKIGSIIINDFQLSSTHCEFAFHGLRYFVKDLGSTNGVFINGKKAEVGVETEIKVFDKLRIGSVTYVVDEKPVVRIGSQHNGLSPKVSLRGILTFFGASLVSKFITWFVILIVAAFFMVIGHETIVLPYGITLIVFLQLPGLALLFWYLRIYFFRKSFTLSLLTSIGCIFSSLFIAIVLVSIFSVPSIGERMKGGGKMEAASEIRLLKEDEVKRVSKESLEGGRSWDTAAIIEAYNKFYQALEREDKNELRAHFTLSSQASRNPLYKKLKSYYPSPTSLTWQNVYGTDSTWRAITAIAGNDAYLILFISSHKNWKVHTIYFGMKDKDGQDYIKSPALDYEKLPVLYEPKDRELAFLLRELSILYGKPSVEQIEDHY